MCMKNTVLIVSNYILRYAKEKGKGLSVLQLMDYLYFVQAQVLVVKNRPAFPETLIAKDWGIFVQDVWSKYSWYGNAFIPVSDKPKNSIPDADLIEEVVDNSGWKKPYCNIRYYTTAGALQKRFAEYFGLRNSE